MNTSTEALPEELWKLQPVHNFPISSEHETVALGWWDLVRKKAFWVPMTNVAVEPVHNFAVAGAEVQEAVRNYGRPNVLWHTHLHGGVEPSESDVLHFPEWLVEVGVVYHPPTQKIATYDSNGILCSSVLHS